MMIRLATVEDIETLFEIRTAVRENHQSRQELETLGVTPNSIQQLLMTDGRCWLAEVEGKPVGFSMAIASEQTVFALFILPDYEGRGIGQQLMVEAETWLWLMGAEEIWLTTGTDPALRAHGFYQRLGWQRVGPTANGEIKYIKQNPHY